IRVTGPGGVSQSCQIPLGAALNDGCSIAGLTSDTPGVWEIDFNPQSEASNAHHHWDITVNGSGGEVPGRVWSERYRMVQLSPAIELVEDFTLYYLSREGFLYEAINFGYNGVDSIFASDAA